MPGYGISEDGDGLLPWTWALERLTSSYGYWLATTRPDGRPHLMAVWAVWLDGALWFSSALGSRKALNLAADGRCSIATEAAKELVVVEGVAAVQRDPAVIAAFAAASNAKYEVDFGVDFYDPDVNGVWRIDPGTVIGVDEDSFVTSPTRWTFGA